MRCSRNVLARRILIVMAIALSGLTCFKMWRLLTVGPSHRFSIAYGLILACGCAGAWAALAKSRYNPCAAMLWFAYTGLAAIVGMAILDYMLCQRSLPWILYGPMIAGLPVLKRTSTRWATFTYGLVVGAVLLGAAILYRQPAGALGLIGAAVQLPISRKG